MVTSRTKAVINAGKAASARASRPATASSAVRATARVHAGIVGEAQHAVAALRFCVEQPLQRHLQQWQRVAAMGIRHQHLRKRTSLAVTSHRPAADGRPPPAV